MNSYEFKILRVGRHFLYLEMSQQKGDKDSLILNAINNTVFLKYECFLRFLFFLILPFNTYCKLTDINFTNVVLLTILEFPIVCNVCLFFQSSFEFI